MPLEMHQREAIPDALLEVAAEWMARIQDPEVSASDFAEWEKWLASNPRHAAAYAAVEEVWTLVGRIDPPWPTPSELAEQTIGSASSPKVEKRRPSSFRPWLASAAAIILAVIGIWFASTTKLVLETGTAEHRSLLLEDGSRVTLAAETRIVVDQRPDRRGLELERGEAYFEVAHDPNRPFVVRVKEHDAVAVGTAFNVNANSDQLTITVTEGVVQLQSVKENGTELTPVANIQLHVGERVVAHDTGMEQLSRVTRPEDAISWRNGRYEYMNESLQNVIQDVNRYTNRKIRFTDPSIGQLRFTGTVIFGELNGWLTALQLTFPLEVVDRGSHRLLQRSGPRPPERQSNSPAHPPQVLADS